MSRHESEDQRDRFDEVARELEEHRPRPSEALVNRIERLAEHGSVRRARSARVRVTKRRMVLALAATLALAIVGGVVIGNLGGSPLKKPAPHVFAALNRTPTTQSNDAVGASESGVEPKEYAQELPPNTTASKSQAARVHGTLSAPMTTGNRLAQLRAVLTIKVERSELSAATKKAEKIARSLGGYFATGRYNVPAHGTATSELKLKIPAAKAQDALVRVSALGEILSQKVSLNDLQGAVEKETDQIATLNRRIDELVKALKDPSLTPSARSQLQVELANARAERNSLRAQRSAHVRRGRMATITLTLTTGDLPKPAAKPSRIYKAIVRAWNGLSSEISWAATGIIVASPFLVLALIAVPAVRIRRRREERRLLEK
jgi:hypothetical protein